MKYFSDEFNFTVINMAENSGLKNAPQQKKRSYKKNVNLCIAIIIVFIFAASGGAFYFNQRVSLNGMGGAEAWTNVDTVLEQFENPIPLEEIGLTMDLDVESVADDENLSPLSLTYFTYRVKAGDMIGVLAENFGITQDTIISVNSIKQSRLIQIGQFLKIPSMTGILYTAKVDGESLASVAEKYEVSLQKCANLNGLAADSELAAGSTIFVPDASLDWATLQEINGDLFIKPVRSYRLTSYYGWRSSPFSGSRSFHSGVDMAAPQGTNIYAALNGRVTFTGFNATYGNYVIVTHHSGYQTLYGHMSAILVTKGQYVDTNTRIGKVGSTGLSTGPHLHFTVMKNGSTVNPIALWK